MPSPQCKIGNGYKIALIFHSLMLRLQRTCNDNLFANSVYKICFHEIWALGPALCTLYFLYMFYLDQAACLTWQIFIYVLFTFYINMSRYVEGVPLYWH